MIDNVCVADLPRVIPLPSARSRIEVPVFANVPWSAVKSATVKLPDASLRAIVFAAVSYTHLTLPTILLV